MNNKFNFSIATISVVAIVLSAIASSASAQVTTGVGLGISAPTTASVGGSGTGLVRTRLNANASGTVRANAMAQLVTRAGTEIMNRVNALNNLETRVDAMVKLSGDEKTNLSSQIQAQVTAMANLQAEITADQASNSTSSLKTDVQSITKAYRIYALILPQGEIAAASDRILTITDAMATLAGDLQARITAAQSAGVNMDTSVSALADLNAKVADATTQANAAVAATAPLQPDNGSSTVMQSNAAVLKQGRSDIQAAQSDLVAARKDALTIIAAIKASEKVTATATTTASQ